MNHEDISPRVALVTGGSRGIGRAVVTRLAHSGWSVAFTYAGSKEASQQLVSELREKGANCRADQADVRDFERAQQLSEEISSDLGPVGLLVNNAGIKKDQALFGMTLKAWQEVIDTNLGGTFNYCRAVVPSMMKRRSGVIVNVVSVSGIVGLPGQVNYSASKAGVIGLTRSLAREVARFGLRINAVAPGLIETDMTRDMPEKALKRLLEQIPARSMGTADQVAQVVEFLAGDGAAYITGQVLPIDGGMA